MNLLPKPNVRMSSPNKSTMNTLLPDVLSLDLSCLEQPTEKLKPKVEDPCGDDVLVDISESTNGKRTIDSKLFEESKDVKPKETMEVPKLSELPKSNEKSDMKLSDIFVKLESIKPSSIPPIVALEEKNSISLTFHFAKDKPREDVTVVVVTITSKNENPLKNILFRAIVPKVC